MSRRKCPQFGLVLVVALLVALVGPVRPGVVRAAGSGTIMSWGADGHGQLGDGGGLPGPIQPSPVQVAGPGGVGTLSGVKAIAAGGSHTLALKADATVWAWGLDEHGQLGDGGGLPGTNQSAPVQVAGPGGSGTLGGIKAIAAGQDYSLALVTDGTVLAWGLDDSGQLGDGGSTTDKSSPVRVVGPGGVGTLTDVVAIAAGAFHSLALKSDGTVWAWGYGHFGQLGDGGDSYGQPSPVQVLGPGGVGALGGVTAIAAGGDHSLALQADGTVWAWGISGYGQLGDRQCNADRHSPVQVLGPGGVGTLGGVAAIAAGLYHSLALKNDGTVWAWGLDSEGQLGNGASSVITCGNSRVAISPVRVAGPGGVGALGGVTAITAGGNHSLALQADGTVWAWGNDGAGELGDGPGSPTTCLNGVPCATSPVQVVGAGGGGTVAVIAAGGATRWR